MNQIKMRNLKFTVAVLALLFAVPTIAQRTMGGQPYNWSEKTQTKKSIASFDLGQADEDMVREIAEEQSPSDDSFRYGFQRLLSADVLANGTWQVKPRGGRICTYAIKSPGAAMLSVQFSEFDLEPGAMLYLYNEDRTEFLGGFNENSELPTGDFATAVVQGETVFIEYHEPATRRSKKRKLVVEGVTHGVVDIFELNQRHSGNTSQTRDYWPGYPSGPCHNNVVCPIANGWEDAVSSVAMFLRPDGGGCTGVMVNNTANDGTPYFYLANHCYQPTESQWVFYFNYEAPNCIGDTGQTVETIVGAHYRAAEHFADFVLVELFNSPQTVYNVYFSGWDRDTVTTPSLGASIMHPAFDVKKISLDYGPFLGQGVGNSIGANTPVWVLQFDTGIVEHGASGGPIFNQDQRVIGNLADAWGDCTTNAGVISSKFGYQWEHGPIPAQRLKEWLDPGNTGLTSIGGYGSAPAAVTVPVQVFLEGPFDDASGLMRDDLRAAGYIPLTEPYTAMGYTHTGGGGESMDAAMLATSGSTAVVDWLVVELRDAFDSTLILASQSALLLRDGAVVATDGSTLSFPFSAGDYYVALRHRNHLPVMTNAPVSLSSSSSNLNLSDGSVAIYGGAPSVMTPSGALYLMANGDVIADQEVKYAGVSNDRDPILIGIGGSVPTNTVDGYFVEDVNMDGSIKYTGNGNDRDRILITIGGVIPTNVKVGQLP